MGKYLLTVMDFHKKGLDNFEINKIARLCSSVSSWKIIIEDRIIAKLEFVEKTEVDFNNYINDIQRLINRNNGYLIIYEEDQFQPIVKKIDSDDYIIIYDDNFNEYLKITILFLFLFFIFYFYFVF